MGVSTKIIEVLQNMYRSATFRVRVDANYKTKVIDATQGVLQGDPASPTLFSLLLADIDRYFIEHGHYRINEKIELLLFADDLILLADDIIGAPK